MKENNNEFNALKLTSDAIENISEKLQRLVAINSNVATMAYANSVNMGRDGCGCKGGCDGGCTSW